MILSPFRFSGAKNRLLPIIMPHLNSLLTNSNIYHEPFIGGGSVALEVATKYPNMQIHINDKDEWLTSFWQIVSEDNKTTINDLLALLETPPTIEMFYELADKPPISLLERAYYILFFNRTTFSGIIKRDDAGNIKSSPIGGREQVSKYKVDCRYNFFKLKSKILAIHKLLCGRTQVYNMDIEQYLLGVDKASTMYIDPPYVKAGEMLYNFNMLEQEHKNLATNLQDRTNWLISYDDHPMIRELYKNNTIFDCAAKYSINGKKENWTNKNELLILSGQRS